MVLDIAWCSSALMRSYCRQQAMNSIHNERCLVVNYTMLSGGKGQSP